MENIEFFIPLFGFLAVGAIAVFTMISIAIWTESRVRERDAYYRNEMLKKLADAHGAGADDVLRVMREEEHREARKRREGLKIGGLAAAAAGLGITMFLWHMEKVRMVGMIPFAVGLALLLYAFVLAPKD